jgi:hypothetical protein
MVASLIVSKEIEVFEQWKEHQKQNELKSRQAKRKQQELKEIQEFQ